MARTTIREEDITSGAVPTTGIVGVSTFTSSGTWTKATREAALGVTIKRVIVEVQGGGGGGGGSSSTSYGSGSGGGGGYTKKLIDVSSISSATITVGSGGTGGTSSSNGVTGGNSSWVDGTNTLTGGGGVGGTGNSGSAYGNGGSGGTASGGDLNIAGSRGGRPLYERGDGGGSFFSSTTLIGSGNTQNAVGYGGGGTGSKAVVTAGANASDGIVIVTEIAG